jgi:N-methylhydantoinase B
VLEPGELLGHLLSGGGGYGPPAEREPERVRDDVLARFVSFERARDVYRVAFTREVLDDSLEIDREQTARLREKV